jgi:hypothetical protein
MNHEHKTITLLGGKTIDVHFENGERGELKLRQFRLAEYEDIFRVHDDEFALVARACGQPRELVQTLAPESYELALATVREVNANGFFAFAARRLERAAANLRQLPAELVEKILERQKSTSLTRSPILPPPAG